MSLPPTSTIAGNALATRRRFNDLPYPLCNERGAGFLLVAGRLETPFHTECRVDTARPGGLKLPGD